MTPGSGQNAAVGAASRAAPHPSPPLARGGLGWARSKVRLGSPDLPCFLEPTGQRVPLPVGPAHQLLTPSRQPLRHGRLLCTGRNKQKQIAILFGSCLI